MNAAAKLAGQSIQFLFDELNEEVAVHNFMVIPHPVSPKTGERQGWGNRYQFTVMFAVAECWRPPELPVMVMVTVVLGVVLFRGAKEAPPPHPV